MGEHTMSRRYVGVDPYIERQLWSDFHHNMIITLQAMLLPQLLPKYSAQVEERVYVEHNPPNGVRRVWRPDVSIVKEPEESPSPFPEGSLAVAEPIVLTTPLPEEQREPYIAILALPERQLVTIIEVLSPSNKRPNSDGRREYLAKRQQILQSAVHLVEIDLLLQGERLPTVEPLPEADFYVFVSRGNARPAVEVYRWKLNQPLPTIRVPLLTEDPDLLLNLQEAYEQTFARACYDMRLDYEVS